MYVVIVYLLLVTANVAWWWRSDSLLRGVPSRWETVLRGAWAMFIGLQVGTLSMVMLNYSIAYLAGTSASELNIPGILAGLAYVWHLALLPMILMFWLITACVRCFVTVGRWLRSRWNSASGETRDVAVEDVAPASRSVSRRVVLASLIAAPPALALAVTGASWPRLAHFRLNRMTVALPQLPAELDGLTIAHLSDTHVGYFTSDSLIGDIVDSVNGLDADLVAVTGDLVNRSLKDLPAATEMIRALRSRHGVFMCEGNHDLIQDAERFRRESLQAGLPLLVNQSTTLSINGARLQLLALRWGSGRRGVNPSSDRSEQGIWTSMHELLEQRDPAAFPILLAHHPHAFDPAAVAGIPLTLAGHTHGGQIHMSDSIGFGPWIYRYWSGYYRRGDSACIVSNGTGNWFPVRVNAPAELIHLTLRRA